MTESHDYSVDITNTGLKTGTLSSTDDALAALEVASPPQFGGPAGVWSPEHLYVAALSSCLMTTFRSIAENSGLTVLAYSDHATGHLRRGEDRMFAFDSVILRPRVVIADPTKTERTVRLLHKAETACLVSRSVASEVVLEPTVEVGEAAGSAR
jgi:organic hydroperoxide reductase OsmC/OhrA